MSLGATASTSTTSPASSGSSSARLVACLPAALAAPRLRRGSAGERRRLFACARLLLGAAPRGAEKA
eukprot:scaffold1981_cov110-Isochrysis_galbana.AAC.2